MNARLGLFLGTIQAESGMCNETDFRRISQLEALLSVRDARNEIWLGGTFRDHAWFMILDLYLSMLRRKRISVSSLCLASGGTQTTSLRRIYDLVRLGVIQREQDTSDRRRVYLVLSSDVVAHLQEMLDRMHIASVAATSAHHKV
jgi:hypothetical protein